MKRLYRSRRDRVILGVAGGLADYFEVDVAIVRLLWVLLAFAAGPGTLLVYLVAGLIIPEEPLAPRAEVVTDARNVSAAASDIDRELEELARAGGTPDATGPAGAERFARRHGRSNLILGVILTVFGALLLAHNLFRWLDLQRFWPVLIIIAGGLLIWRSLERNGNVR